MSTESACAPSWPAVYEIDGLRKVYRESGVVANDGISLSIRAGEIFGILGPNGAGKSTLVRQLVGLLKPTSGSLRLFGLDLSKNAASIARRVAYLPQSPVALFDLTAREALLFTARLRGLSAPAAAVSADGFLAEFDLEASRDTLLEHLSGGQVRLVGLGAALMGELPVLVLDEPTNDLDPVNRRRVWAKLLDLKQRQRTILLVTHNVGEAERVLDRVAIVDSGRVIALGSPAELKRQVDDRVRLELAFKHDAAVDAMVLASLGEVRKSGDRRWMLLVPRANAGTVVSAAMNRVDLASLDDFRIVTASLEDVYLQLGGVQPLGGE